MMKKVLLLFISLCFSVIKMNAQQIHFPDSNFHWNEEHRRFEPMQTDITRYGTMYLEGDSLINGKKYLKLYYKYTDEYRSYPPPSTPVYANHNMLFALLFNDTANHQVFMKGNTVDHLLYDFNLKLYDTLYSGEYVVRKIDTIITSDSIARRHWVINSKLSVDSSSDCWSCAHLYEGLGFIGGLDGIGGFSLLPWGEYRTDWVSCWSIPGSTCGMRQFVGISNDRKNDLVIAPNPAENYFDVKMNVLKKYKLFNALGQSMELPYQFHEDFIRFDCSGLKNGIYYLVAEDARHVYSGKVMIIK